VLTSLVERMIANLFDDAIRIDPRYAGRRRSVMPRLLGILDAVGLRCAGWASGSGQIQREILSSGVRHSLITAAGVIAEDG
jgi:hypothetical protein